VTVQTPGWAIQASSHPAVVPRQAAHLAYGAPFATFAGGIQAVGAGGGHGVRPGDFIVAQNGTPNMSVNVPGGSFAIRGTENQHQGVYQGYNDGTVNVAIAASDPTNARKDLVVLKVRDAFYSGASNDFSIAVVTGVASGAPVDPTPPANALVIARVNVPATATSIVTANIVDLRTFAYALGGIGITTSALPANPAFTGQVEAFTDLAALEIYNGSTFSALVRPAYGVLPAWASAPVLTQSGVVTTTLGRSAFVRIGRWVQADGYVTVTGTGTASNTVTVSLPFTAASNNPNSFLGTGKIFDSSTGFEYVGMWVVASTTTMKLQLPSNGGVAAQFAGVALFTAALAVNDVVTFTIGYEAAADAA